MARVPKTHIMRWAPQDWRTSRVRSRSAVTGDLALRAIYREILDALWEHGGSISADPEILADELLAPPEEIARCLPILAKLGGDGDGGIVIEDGRITNRRISRDLVDEIAYREQQALTGALGGRAKAIAIAKQKLATASHQSSDCHEKASDSVAKCSLPPPVPSPVPSPVPMPVPIPNEEEVPSEPPLRTDVRDARRKRSDDRFEEFWAVVWLKVGKEPARRAWRKLNAEAREQAIRAAPVYAAALERSGAKPKWPQGWLNDHRFDDDPAALARSNGNGRGRDMTDDEIDRHVADLEAKRAQELKDSGFVELDILDQIEGETKEAHRIRLDKYAKFEALHYPKKGTEDEQRAKLYERYLR